MDYDEVNLLSLSDEILYRIMVDIPLENLCEVCLVNSRLNSICLSTYFWAFKANHDIGVVTETFLEAVNDNVRWARGKYILYYLLRNNMYTSYETYEKNKRNGKIISQNIIPIEINIGSGNTLLGINIYRNPYIVIVTINQDTLEIYPPQPIYDNHSNYDEAITRLSFNGSVINHLTEKIISIAASDSLKSQLFTYKMVYLHDNNKFAGLDLSNIFVRSRNVYQAFIIFRGIIFNHCKHKNQWIDYLASLLVNNSNTSILITDKDIEIYALTFMNYMQNNHDLYITTNRKTFWE